MAFDIVAVALDLIAAYGLIAILVLLVLDGALLLPVFPGEIVLIMAVAAYAHDVQSLVFIIFVTTAAGVAGSLLLYGITRGGGRRLVDRFPRLFMMPRKRRERLERSFQRPSGQSLVLFLRLVPLTRILVNIPAGLAKMPIVRFLVLSTIGLLIYHGAFLWFAYEANRPGSTIATQRERLQEAYASPAWEVVAANQVIAGLALLVVGVVIGTRAAIHMHRDPAESTGSLIGWATTTVLIGGGAATALATYTDPDAVYDTLALGGVDIHAVAASLGYAPALVLWGASIVAILFGVVLARMRRTARRRRKEHKRLQKDLQDRPVTATSAPVVFAQAVQGPRVVLDLDADAQDATDDVEGETEEDDGPEPSETDDPTPSNP